ncbi:MAG: DNA/RNA nuclease SfsA [Puniceicoccales bacterium]|jgi:sugar fermentation stimulation protein A|nr:DNA/RNA nuclease SfsA [Puniceicoccales bacterium]
MAIKLDLVRGELVARPNRFVFTAKVNGETVRLHCPVTGSIGGICDFSSMPCLLSPAGAGGRSTAGTVEGISLDRGKSWIGINQNHVNRWMEQFLQENALDEMVPCAGATVSREVRVGNSRLDLCVMAGERRTYIEVKTPMRDLLLGDNVEFHRPSSSDYFARGIKHFEELAKLAVAGNRTVVALCCMYDASPFRPPQTEWGRHIQEAVNRARHCGVEMWQVNLKLSPKRISVASIRNMPPFFAGP